MPLALAGLTVALFSGGVDTAGATEPQLRALRRDRLYKSKQDRLDRKRRRTEGRKGNVSSKSTSRPTLKRNTPTLKRYRPYDPYRRTRVYSSGKSKRDVPKRLGRETRKPLIIVIED
ncbi:MAG: hypothetical protein AAGE89_10185 [Pseudomonadota bacterium]